MDLQTELTPSEYQFIVNWMIRLGINFHEIDSDQLLSMEDMESIWDINSDGVYLLGILEDLTIVISLKKSEPNISVKENSNTESNRNYVIYSISCEIKSKCSTNLHLENESKNLTSLFAIPESIGTLCGLNYLRLKGISLPYIPQSVSKLRFLEEWDWIEGKIPEGSIDLSLLTRLKIIRFNSNDLQMIPEWIFTIPDLQELDLFDNPLKYCPYHWPNWLHFNLLILDEEPINERYIQKTQFQDFPWSLGLLMKEKPQLKVVGLPENWDFIQNFRLISDDTIDMISWKRQAYIHCAEILNPEFFIPHIISKIQDNKTLDEIDKAFPMWLLYYNYLLSTCIQSSTQTAKEVQNILITNQKRRVEALHIF